MPLPAATRKVFAIHAHSICSRVAGRSVVFPLEYLGFDVSPIYCNQFTNHLGYPQIVSKGLPCDTFKEMIDCLVNNGLSFYDYVLSGCFADEELLKEFRNAVVKFQAANPAAIYICDPVLGDVGAFYKADLAQLVPFYQRELLPLAKIVTPNQFELEVLSGRKIETEGDVIAAMDACHLLGVEIVVCSSCKVNIPQSDNGSKADDFLVAYASRRHSTDETKRYRVRFPRLRCQFSGPGDLFLSIFIAQFDKFQGDLEKALERSVSICHAILQLTWTKACDRTDIDPSIVEAVSTGSSARSSTPSELKARSCAAMELRLIEGRHLLNGDQVSPIFACEDI